MTIIVNGEPRDWSAPTITYENVLEIVGAKPVAILSMVFKAKRNGDHHYQGILNPGRSADASEGLIVNAADTGNA